MNASAIQSMHMHASAVRHGLPVLDQRSAVSTYVQHASYEIPGQIFVPRNVVGTVYIFGI